MSQPTPGPRRYEPEKFKEQSGFSKFPRTQQGRTIEWMDDCAKGIRWYRTICSDGREFKMGVSPREQDGGMRGGAPFYAVDIITHQANVYEESLNP